MIGQDGGVDRARMVAGARRLREIAASLRARADEAERLLDPVRSLDTPGAWQGSYPARLRETLALVAERVAQGATALRERADVLESAAMDHELAAEVWRFRTSASTVGSR